MSSALTVLVCALALLGRSGRNVPHIQLIDVPPSHASIDAEAFVQRGIPRIFLITNTPTFRAARAGDTQALKRLASIIVHEEWHLLHGDDESGAYAAQLTALGALGAAEGSALYSSVKRSMLFVLQAQRRPQPTPVLILAPEGTGP